MRHLAALLTSFLIASHASAMDYLYSGYLKSYFFTQQHILVENSTEKINSNQQVQSAARFMLTLFPNSNSSAEIHYDIQPIYFSGSVKALVATDSVSTNQDKGYRIKDLDIALGSTSKHLGFIQNLDRLNFQYRFDSGDLTIGRQAINLGTARFINPNDIFLPFDIQTLNTEYRTGVDAIRYQWSLGDFSFIDFGLVMGKDMKAENNALYIRSKQSVQGFDIETNLVIRDTERLYGIGFETAFDDFGLWFESAYMDLRSNTADNYWRASVGADYPFSPTLIGAIEYHYNGAGEHEAEDYLKVYSSLAYESLGVYLLGKHYLIPAISWQAGPLTTLSASGFFNLDDQSNFLKVTLDQSWSDDLYSDFGLYLGIGDTLRQNSYGLTLPQSEFGNYPLSIYGSIRYYY